MPQQEQSSTAHHAGRAHIRNPRPVFGMVRTRNGFYTALSSSNLRQARKTSNLPSVSGGKPFSILIYELVAAARSRDPSKPQPTEAFDQLINDVLKAPVPPQGENVMLDPTNLSLGLERFSQRVAKIQQKNDLSLLKNELQHALKKVDECEAAMEGHGPPDDQRKRRAQEEVDEQLSQVEAARKRLKVNTPKDDECHKIDGSVKNSTLLGRDYGFT
ncbi:hypothetical protein PV04_05743 [Phialophora macrospora]|uniref:Uncharacterized protein n=1 Tax=Phialophora macrospora TaxID=1851006 RepID=A0A0D2DWC0_9EURO|nr:hypothetical protein PV04_05743 [Phialophora macrospora]